MINDFSQYRFAHTWLLIYKKQLKAIMTKGEDVQGYESLLFTIEQLEKEMEEFERRHPPVK